jgi:hypothetical protein
MEMITYKLLRENDNLIIEGLKIKFIEWDEDDRFKEMHDEPSIGMSLMIDPHPFNYTWLTTVITSFSEEGNILKFATKNSNYILEKISNEV